ncbi:MAG: aminodeoxychorismate synthase component I [Microcoleaceae cyanobacterium]
MNQLIIYDAAEQQWLRFENPIEVIQADSIPQVLSQFQRLNQLIERHQYYGAGFMSYEAAAAFDPNLDTHRLTDFPLLWFGVYSAPEAIDIAELTEAKNQIKLDWVPTLSQIEYEKAIAKIKQYIYQGDTYQVNYTYRLKADFIGNSWNYFLQLIQAQPVNYAAYLETETFTICSASPELFFCLNGDKITARPMKGTASRGLTLAEDQQLAKALQSCPKNRAENVMIVDMLRNDIGRIADFYSVQVPSLFDVEKYPTLWQMTSTVAAKTHQSLDDIMTALFPCASITGAPKRRTMEIIRELETTPRKIYTGSIGFITPQRQAQFNVAIRTVLIDKITNIAEYGVGSGIVWDSDSQAEYIECQTKTRFLKTCPQPFQLLETLLWEANTGYFLLDYHLQRLQNSAIYFNYNIELERIKNKLIGITDNLKEKSYKIRLLVSATGEINSEAIPYSQPIKTQPVKLRLSPTAIDSSNPFLYHKTTNRSVYQQAKANTLDCDDVILWNERGEITETCIYNIIVEHNGEYLTPAVNCGLLAGTYRQLLIDKKEIKEAILSKDILTKANNIYVINSVQKRREAVLLL